MYLEDQKSYATGSGNLLAASKKYKDIRGHVSGEDRKPARE